jgi:hypothetical protein
VEAGLIVLALLLAGVILARGFASGSGDRGDQPPPHLPTAAFDMSAVPLLPTLAASLARRPPLHIFTGPPARVHRDELPAPSQAEYRLALARRPGGRWASVLHTPAVESEGGTLTVTLIVPWSELAERYSAVNLVVR